MVHSRCFCIGSELHLLLDSSTLAASGCVRDFCVRPFSAVRSEPLALHSLGNKTAPPPRSRAFKVSYSATTVGSFSWVGLTGVLGHRTDPYRVVICSDVDVVGPPPLLDGCVVMKKGPKSSRNLLPQPALSSFCCPLLLFL